MIWVLGIDPGESTGMVALQYRGPRERPALLHSACVYGKGTARDKREETWVETLCALTKGQPPAGVWIESHGQGQTSTKGKRGRLPPYVWIRLGECRGYYQHLVRTEWGVRAQDMDRSHWPKLMSVSMGKRQQLPVEGWHRCAEAAGHVAGFDEHQAQVLGVDGRKATQLRLVDQAEAALIAKAGLRLLKAAA